MDPLVLNVRTHSFPPLRSSDVGVIRVEARIEHRHYRVRVDRQESRRRRRRGTAHAEVAGGEHGAERGRIRAEQRRALEESGESAEPVGASIGVARPELDAAETGNVEAILEVERSEEHTSELQSLMRISYAVFCLKKKKTENTCTKQHHRTK